MNHTLTTLLFLLATATASALPESYYQDIFAAEISGQTEVTAGDGTRCDILTDSYAIEVDFARKWGEAIGSKTSDSSEQYYPELRPAD